jgi:LuxR family maltose regulon positive regulatory protein
VALARRIVRPYLEFSGLAYRAATVQDRSYGRALEGARQAIEFAERHGWTDDPAAGVACTLIGSLLAWQGRLEEAEPWLQRAEGTLRVEAEPAAVVAVYIVRGELELARNRNAEALAALEAAERLGRRLGLAHRTGPSSRALLMHALVRLDETERAEQFLASLNDEDRERGDVRVATAELRLAQCDPNGALAALVPVLAEPSLLSWSNWLAHAYVLEATIRDALDDEAAAERALERALDFAEPNGLVTPFLSYAAPGLLERHARRSSHASLLAEIQAVLAGATPAPRAGPRPLLEALSESELRVLRYLPTNLTAPEIARELSVSPHTVRTHVKNLYAKLGTHHRAGAVERARALGLLAPYRTAPATR